MPQNGEMFQKDYLKRKSDKKIVSKKRNKCCIDIKVKSLAVSLFTFLESFGGSCQDQFG